MNWWAVKTRGVHHRHVAGVEPPITVELILVTDNSGAALTPTVTLNDAQETIAVTDNGGTGLGVDL